MSYRPLMDQWFCTRAKLLGGVKYYGSYPGGFPERARVLLCANMNDPVLHVCGGFSNLYPYYGGYGAHDARLDLSRLTKPEYFGDVRDAAAYPPLSKQQLNAVTNVMVPWRAMIADPPYSLQDATRYVPGSDKYPKPRLILRNMLLNVEPGCKVGILDYVSPRPPADIPVRLVAKITVAMPFDNRDRTFTVYEKLDLSSIRKSRLPVLKTSLF